jgi:RecA/RadA recombinase
VELTAGKIDQNQYRTERAAMEEYSTPKAGLGEFAVLMHPFGDGLLEMAYRVVASNTMAMVTIDSIAVCKPSKLIEENEIGDDERGSGKQIQMLIQFGNKCVSAFSGRYDSDFTPTDGGEMANETCVVAINQAREDQRATAMARGNYKVYKPAMGEALHHFWNLGVEFQKGEALGEQTGMGGRDVWHKHGQEVRATGYKSRVGPPDRKASWHFYTESHGEFVKGQIDVARESRIWGTQYEVIHQEGAWYVLPDGRRINGKEKVDRALREDVALRESIDEEVLVRCRR